MMKVNQVQCWFGPHWLSLYGWKHFSKLLCFDRRSKSYRFETTWGFHFRVNYCFLCFAINIQKNKDQNTEGLPKLLREIYVTKKSDALHLKLLVLFFGSDFHDLTQSNANFINLF